MFDDPRQWKVVIDGRRLVSFEELVNRLHEAGCRLRSTSDKALLDACASVPDIALSKWAGSPGAPWEPVRTVLKASREAAGFHVDADIEQYDLATGNLRVRRNGATDGR